MSTTLQVVLARGLALAATWLIPAAAFAQVAPSGLTPEESEAYEMGLELAFACSPRRHNQATGSESVIQRGPGQLLGTAAYFHSAEGTFLVLEEYDEDLAGHCLVFGWFGGALEPGRYAIDQLAYRTVEAELDAGRHSFFSMSAIRHPDENSILVAESGTLEIVSVGPGTMAGRFELAGFLVDGDARGGDVAWSGTFSALEGEG